MKIPRLTVFELLTVCVIVIAIPDIIRAAKATRPKY